MDLVQEINQLLCVRDGQVQYSTISVLCRLGRGDAPQDHEWRPLWDRNGREIRDIDASSFRHLGGRFFADGRRVFALCQRRDDEAHLPYDVFAYFCPIEVDPSKIRVLNEFHAITDSVLYSTAGLQRRLRPGEPVRLVPDAPLFLPITPEAPYPIGRSSLSRLGDGFVARYHHLAGMYATTGADVIFLGREIPAADPASFRHLGANYFADENHVYCFGDRLDADRGSFLVDPAIPFFAVDKNRIYQDGRRLALDRYDFEWWAGFFHARPGLKGYWHDRRIVARYYTADDATVYYRGNPLNRRDGSLLEGVDAASFRHLGGRFCSDGRRIYVQAQLGGGASYDYFYTLDDADMPSFRALGERYAKDRKQAYYVREKTIKTRSADAFELVPCQYDLEATYHAKDREAVYCAGVKIKGADAATFHHVGSSYYADGKAVYYGRRSISGADPRSFVFAGFGEAATDKERPYHFGAPEPVSECVDDQNWAEFFEGRKDLSGYWWHRARHPPPPAERRDLGDGFSTDGTKIFLEGVSIDELDVATFRNLGHSFVADHNGLFSFAVYHGGFLDGGKLDGGDPDSLTQLAHGYFKDRKNAYQRQWEGHAEGRAVDTRSFEALSTSWSRDGSRVYYDLRRMKGLNPRRVEILSDSYARIDDAIYYRDRRVDGIDSQTARILREDFVVDGIGAVFCGRRKCAKAVDGKTLSFLSRSFAKDAKCVYYFNTLTLKPIAEADVASFRVVDEVRAEDAERTYLDSEMKARFQNWAD